MNQDANAERNEYLDRAWLSMNLLVALILAGFFFLFFFHEATGTKIGSTDDLFFYLITIGAGAVIWSVGLTLFVVAIPSRLVLNLIIRSRRIAYRGGTIALVVAFAALALMFYVLWKFPAEG